MITKIHKSKDLSGLLRYVYREDADPVIVASTATGFDRESVYRELAASSARVARLRDDTTHMILSVPPEDDVSELAWGEIVTEYMEAMGYGECLYVAIKHNDTDHPHVHIVASRVDAMGRAVDDFYNFPRSERAARVIEERHELTRVECSWELPGRRMGQTGYHLDRREGRGREKQRVHDEVRLAMLTSSSIVGLSAALKSKDITLVPRLSDDKSKVTGVYFQTDSVKISGSKVARDFSWRGLTSLLDYDHERDHVVIAAPIKTPEADRPARKAQREGAEDTSLERAALPHAREEPRRHEPSRDPVDLAVSEESIEADEGAVSEPVREDERVSNTSPPPPGGTDGPPKTLLLPEKMPGPHRGLAGEPRPLSAREVGEESARGPSLVAPAGILDRRDLALLVIWAAVASAPKDVTWLEFVAGLKKASVTLVPEGTQGDFGKIRGLYFEHEGIRVPASDVDRGASYGQLSRALGPLTRAELGGVCDVVAVAGVGDVPVMIAKREHASRRASTAEALELPPFIEREIKGPRQKFDEDLARYRASSAGREEPLERWPGPALPPFVEREIKGPRQIFLEDLARYRAGERPQAVGTDPEIEAKLPSYKDFTPISADQMFLRELEERLGDAAYERALGESLEAKSKERGEAEEAIDEIDRVVSARERTADQELLARAGAKDSSAGAGKRSPGDEDEKKGERGESREHMVFLREGLDMERGEHAESTLDSGRGVEEKSADGVMYKKEVEEKLDKLSREPAKLTLKLTPLQVKEVLFMSENGDLTTVAHKKQQAVMPTADLEEKLTVARVPEKPRAEASTRLEREQDARPPDPSTRPARDENSAPAPKVIQQERARAEGTARDAGAMKIGTSSRPSEGGKGARAQNEKRVDEGRRGSEPGAKVRATDTSWANPAKEPMQGEVRKKFIDHGKCEAVLIVGEKKHTVMLTQGNEDKFRVGEHVALSPDGKGGVRVEPAKTVEKSAEKTSAEQPCPGKFRGSGALSRIELAAKARATNTSQMDPAREPRPARDGKPAPAPTHGAAERAPSTPAATPGIREQRTVPTTDRPELSRDQVIAKAKATGTALLHPDKEPMQGKVVEKFVIRGKGEAALVVNDEKHAIIYTEGRGRKLEVGKHVALSPDGKGDVRIEPAKAVEKSAEQNKPAPAPVSERAQPVRGVEEKQDSRTAALRVEAEVKPKAPAPSAIDRAKPGKPPAMDQRPTMKEWIAAQKDRGVEAKPPIKHGVIRGKVERDPVYLKEGKHYVISENNGLKKTLESSPKLEEHRGKETKFVRNDQGDKATTLGKSRGFSR